MDTTKAETSMAKKYDKCAGTTYVPKLSESITKHLKYFVPDLRVAPRPSERMYRFYSQLKQPLKKSDKTGVVYQIPCDAKDTTYIGETIHKTWTTHNSTHVKESRHQFDFDVENIKILKREE